MRLVIDNEAIVHFPGGGIAQTGTLCGQIADHREHRETNRRKLTCEACREIICNVEEYIKATKGAR